MIGLSLAPRRRHRRGGSPGQVDTTPPVLSALSIDEGNASLSVNSSEFGLLRWLLDDASTYADAAALAAAKPGAQASGVQGASTGSNTVMLDLSGVAPGTWRLHVGATDGAGNVSNVLSGDFTITSAGADGAFSSAFSNAFDVAA